MVRPHILIVHGLWHTPAHYARLSSLFDQHGYPVSCPALPSFGGPPHIGLKEDVLAIRAELDRLLALDKEVVVIAHSYGGVVATDAITASRAFRARSLAGLGGGVVRLLCMCSYVLLPGQSLATAFAGAPAYFYKIDESAMMTVIDPAPLMYGDLPPAEQEHWCSLLQPCPAITQSETLSNWAYIHVPSTYLFCTKDQVIPYPLQRWMVDKAIILGAQFDEDVCDTGHSPQLSEPLTVVNLVERALASNLTKDLDLSAVQQEKQQAFAKILEGFAEMMADRNRDAARTAS